MNEECKIGQPYANCEHNYISVFVPNSNPGSKHERLVLGKIIEIHVRANHNQQRSGGKCDVSSDLNKVMSML